MIRTDEEKTIHFFLISFSVSDLSLKRDCLWLALGSFHVPPLFFSSYLPPPFLHSPIPPSCPFLWFKLDNENNEFGVCFILFLSLPPPLFILVALSLSYCPNVTLTPLPATYICRFSHLLHCFFYFFLYIDIIMSVYFIPPSLCLLLRPIDSFSHPFPVFFLLSVWFHAPAALLSVCLRLC